MCVGPELMIASALISGAGTALQSRETNKNAKRAMNAKNSAFQAHQTHQQQFADEAGAAFGTNTQQQGRESFDEKKDEDITKRKQAFGNIRTTPDYNIGTTSSAPKNVILAREAASEKAGAETDRDVDALSALSGYGGALFNQGLDRNKFARLFGNIQDKAGADTRLLPNEMSAAATNSQKAPSMLPVLMKAAGAGLGMYGAGGGSFTNTIEGPVAAGAMGPGAPVTQYGMFKNGVPMKAFGSQVVF